MSQGQPVNKEEFLSRFYQNVKEYNKIKEDELICTQESDLSSVNEEFIIQAFIDL